MNDYLNKYFNKELTNKEKEDFLYYVDQDTILKEEFIEIENLLAISSLLPKSNDLKNSQISLSKFMEYVNNKDDTIK